MIKGVVGITIHTIMIRNYFKKVVTITWFRKVNKIALVGMFVAGGVLVGFTKKTIIVDEYGFDGTSWYNYANPIPGTASYSECSFAPSLTCSFMFPAPPSSETLPEDGIPTDRKGIYKVVVLP